MMITQNIMMQEKVEVKVKENKQIKTYTQP